MAKTDKKAAPAEGGEAKGGGKKKLLIIVAAVVLLAGAGAGWFFTMGPGGHHEEHAAPPPLPEPKYVSIGTITANLQPDEQGSLLLQVGVAFKIYDYKLEEKIKAREVELRSRVRQLISSKSAGQLTAPDGQKNLSKEISAEAESILEIKKSGGSKKSAEHGEEGAQEGGHAEAGPDKSAGIVDVLLDPFLIGS
ncbi:MAG: flagellar basal body-associated FliL family protein [Pseudomonadota bacterium]